MSSEEEELVNFPFFLRVGESLEFVGHLELDDVLKIFITSDSAGDAYEVGLFPIEKDLSRGPPLLELRVESGNAVVYRVPLSVDAAIKITLTYAQGATATGGNIRVSVLRAPSRVSRCPVCGALVEPGAKYCGKCGAKLQ